MTIADIIQIILSIFSLIATVAVSVIIYKFERKNERLREKELEKQKAKEIELTARNFIIDNQNDIELLPLCIISQCLHGYDNNVRLIYTKFKKCDREAQKEILRQEKCPITLIEDTEWLNKALLRFQKLEKEYKLATTSALYDGCKYFYRSYERHKKEKVEDIDPFCFVVPGYENRLRMMNGNEYLETNLFSYIDPYLAGVYKEIHNIGKGNAIYPSQPPMDVVWEQFDLGTCDESIVCFWLMKYMITSCKILFEHELTEIKKESWRIFDIDESKIETYEDMFYYTALVLYKTLFDLKDKD